MPRIKMHVNIWVHVRYNQHGDAIVTFSRWRYVPGRLNWRSHFTKAYPYWERDRLKWLIKALNKARGNIMREVFEDGWSVLIARERSYSLSNSTKVIGATKSDDLGVQ